MEKTVSTYRVRRVLQQHVGSDLSLPALITAMLSRTAAWRAVASFCEAVMQKKEAAERARERVNPVRGRRRRPRNGSR
ncbi:hypothetical protein RR48_03793 [Papilio machaon]|uniref:Uncharacterized protein n=1 Tax=Papilio machaon TaxID=76193 RepID=A0A0N0PB71_PAPMA|nr:hypothetical protein RR48_03793 [Papilio machaon]